MAPIPIAPRSEVVAAPPLSGIQLGGSGTFSGDRHRENCQSGHAVVYAVAV
jgi:hypothetical protein